MHLMRSPVATNSGWRFVLGAPCKYTGTPAKEMKQRGIDSGGIGPKKDDCAGKPCRGCANILRGCMEAIRTRT